MTNGDLKSKIHDVLRNGYFSGKDDLVDVSDGSEDCVHLVVVSRKFDGRRYQERKNLIWDELEKGLSPEEYEKITLSIGKSPEEIKAGI